MAATSDRVSSFYTPLDTLNSEIRLLEISSQEISMVICSLSDGPKYGALSYVWGNPSITEIIIVNGKPFAPRLTLPQHYRAGNKEVEMRKLFKIAGLLKFKFEAIPDFITPTTWALLRTCAASSNTLMSLFVTQSIWKDFHMPDKTTFKMITRPRIPEIKFTH
ncbi:hypothetical protein FKW77_003379 [Venturia effusa]|uniref:Heterokaryon incompatibility domain-containing protein n=1 Tax=Venturia effusa TaxID=50376 RepID=A0A517LMJ5_9PEZI|nr:hypothetical protein FKW77_003379 [Venturia effusa]